MTRLLAVVPLTVGFCFVGMSWSVFMETYVTPPSWYCDVGRYGAQTLLVIMTLTAASAAFFTAFCVATKRRKP